jgi:hypothetical protein
MVHRALEAEGAAEVLARRDLGQERVARRAAHALADAVHDPHGQHVPGGRGRRDQRARDRRERVAGDDERLAPPHAVGDAARDDLGQAGHGLREALDEAHESGARSEHAGQERREQRIDHLAAGVGEEADEPETPDGTGKRRHPGRTLADQ